MVDCVFMVGKLVFNRAPSLAGGLLRLNTAENPSTHLANDSSRQLSNLKFVPTRLFSQFYEGGHQKP